jgi:hypothetical protein
MARVSISRILEKVTAMESMLAVMACDLKALRESTDEELKDLDQRARALEADRFPWRVIGGMVAVITLILTAVIFLVSQDDPPPPRRPASMGEVHGSGRG